MQTLHWIVLCALPLSNLLCERQAPDALYTGVLEGTAVRVPAMTGGKIIRLFAEEGREISAGDTVAVIETIELSLQVNQIRATLEGIDVQEEVARTGLQQAQTQLDYLLEQHGRAKVLVENNAAPLQRLDDLDTQVKQARLSHEAVRQQIRELDSKRKQLHAQIDVLQKKITDAVVIAPISGLIETRYYEPGEAVAPLQPVVEIINVAELELTIYIQEQKLPLIRHGQELSIRVDGMSQELKGTINWVSARAEFTPKTILTPETRTSLVYAVKITVLNPDRVLKHGMPVEAVL